MQGLWTPWGRPTTSTSSTTASQPNLNFTSNANIGIVGRETLNEISQQMQMQNNSRLTSAQRFVISFVIIFLHRNDFIHFHIPHATIPKLFLSKLLLYVELGQMRLLTFCIR